MRRVVPAGFAGSVLLLLAGLTYARVPAGSWVRGFAWRQRPDHLAVGMGLAVAGLVLLTLAWLGLVRRAGGRPDGIRVTRWAAACWALPLLPAPPLFSNDAWSYVATGWLTGHGSSPYVVTPSVLAPALRSGVDPMWRGTTSPYGPLPLLYGAAASRLTSDPWLLLLAHRLLACAALAVVAAAVPVLAARAGADPARASALAVASPLVIAHGVAGLHNDLLVCALVLAALAVTGRRRWWLGAALVGLAASVKVVGLAAVPGVVLLSLVPGAGPGPRVRRTAAVGAVALACVLAVSEASGLGLGWLSGLGRTAQEKARLAPTALLGHWMSRLLDAFGEPGRAMAQAWAPVRTVETLGLLALVAVSLVVLLRRPVPTTAAALGGAVTVLVAVTLLGPALHYWYFLWCLPAAACLPLGRRQGAVLMTVLAALGLTAVLDPAVHLPWVAPTALVALALAPVAAWCGATWWPARSWEPRVGSRPEARRTLGRR